MVRIVPLSRTRSALRIAVVRARFNPAATERLLAGALAKLRAEGVPDAQTFVVEVAGAVELALAADEAIRSLKVDAVVCLGAVIRGETDHYDHVCRMAADSIARVALERRVPVAFGVLTCDREEQALARAGGAEGDRGADAVATALEMAELLRALAAGAS
jgi:6,7-dimethyl-8-ribityllumazine synthase